jgi:hypothetical protein
VQELRLSHVKVVPGEATGVALGSGAPAADAADTPLARAATAMVAAAVGRHMDMVNRNIVSPFGIWSIAEGGVCVCLTSHSISVREG